MRLYRPLLVLLTILLVSALHATTKESTKVRTDDIQEKNEKCITCHMKQNRSLTKHWEDSAHEGEDVGCYTCHAAEESEPLSFMHEKLRIKTVLSPNDCKACHEQEVKEMTNSKHAHAGELMASVDSMLAELVASFPETKAAAVNGCLQCHGSIVKAERDSKGALVLTDKGAPVMDWKSWPNSGIGRINPDGIAGNCNACHSRHDFSASRARQPENCGKCHTGPDHPQKEIYETSKHGIAYYSSKKGKGSGGMNIDKKGHWILGKDYSAAPTCATCHMGAYKKSSGAVTRGTHDVGDRLSWTLRPALSVKLNRVTFEDGSSTDVHGEKAPDVNSTYIHETYVREGDTLKSVKAEKKIIKVTSWEDRRDKMKGVCISCHSQSWVTNFYKQYDSQVVTYNEEFARPGLTIVQALKEDKLWDTPLSEPHDLGYIWFEIWHHEGRTARMGAAMQSPDHAYWKGMYKVSRDFYGKFLPKVMELAKEAGKEAKYERLITESIGKPAESWYKRSSDTIHEKK